MDHPGTACQLLCPQQPQNSDTLQSTKSANADKPTFKRERERDEIANAQKPTFQRKRSNKPSSRTETNKQTDELTKPGAAQELPAGQDEAAKLSGIPVSVKKDDTAVPMLPCIFAGSLGVPCWGLFGPIWGLLGPYRTIWGLRVSRSRGGSYSPHDAGAHKDWRCLHLGSISFPRIVPATVCLNLKLTKPRMHPCCCTEQAGDALIQSSADDCRGFPAKG